MSAIFSPATSAAALVISPDLLRRYDVAGPRYTSYPTADRFVEAFTAGDYAQALQRHYADGAPAGWDAGFVSAYATAHPWEDWAETWAHYLHMVDLLETASSFETRPQLPVAAAETGWRPLRPADPFADGPAAFEALVARWVPLTLLVNSLNRSLGHGDAYPFALGPGAQAKLRFVHERIAAVRMGPGNRAFNGTFNGPVEARLNVPPP